MSLTALTDEQALLRETVTQLSRRFAADPFELDSQVADSASLDLLYDLGLPGMRLPETDGGSGASAADVGVVAEAAARFPSVSPFLGPVLAIELLLRASAPGELLRSAANGETRLTVALNSNLGSLGDPSDCVAWDAAGATHAIARAKTGNGLALFKLTGERLPCADLTRSLSAIDEDTEPTAVGALEPEAETGWSAFAITMLACDLLGSIEGALEGANEYARRRQQFGRPIGSFQAIRHLLADAWVSAFAARSAVAHAAECVETRPVEEALLAARTAKAYAANAARSVIETGMQVQGAMGVTWESPSHIFLRRALLDDATLGPVAEQLDRVSESRLRDEPIGPVGADDEPGFRSELRAWLSENAPKLPLPHEGDAHGEAIRAWQQRLHAGGWSGLSIPAEFGGGGRSPLFEGILNEEIAAAGAPPILDSVYLSHVVVAFGSERQQRTWIPRMLSGEDWWCQGFSEPEAGSDLAALRAKATREESDWVINGQKTWTTSGQWADLCLVLARTDPDAPKHKGISAFVVPMDSPGITVRPILQPNGGSEFAEVFFEDVRVGEDSMLGEPGDGWKIAMTTVTLERGPADSGYAAKHLVLLKRLEAAIRNQPERCSDRGTRRSLAGRYMDIEVLRLRVRDSLAERASGNEAGPESSADKLLMIRTEQALHHLAIELMATETTQPQDPSWLSGYLASRAVSIYGGTEQIQKDIVATRVLRLPRD